MIAARTAAALAIACALPVLAACSTETKIGPTTYVTVDPPASSDPPASRSTSPATTAPGSSTPAPLTSAPSDLSSTAAAMTQLPGGCDTLLPLGTLVDALGHDLPGNTAFVVGVADPSIGRLGYINCRYGIAGRSGPAEIEIGVSLYRTADKAQARIEPTVADFTAHAAHATSTTVAGQPATLLEGGVGAGYGPTVVLATGQRTVAVSLRAGSVPTDHVTPELDTLATLATARTSGT